MPAAPAASPLGQPWPDRHGNLLGGHTGSSGDPMPQKKSAGKDVVPPPPYKPRPTPAEAGGGGRAPKRPWTLPPQKSGPTQVVPLPPPPGLPSKMTAKGGRRSDPFAAGKCERDNSSVWGRERR